MNNIIDLSLPLFQGMPHYPTDPPTMLREAKSIKNDRTRVTEVSFGSHAGTHVDVPSHVFPQGKSLEQIELSSFLGKAVKLRLDRFAEYDLAGLEFDGVLLETGWEQCYADPARYFSGSRPAIPIAVADKLMEKGLRFFGCDLPSVDQSGSKEKLIHDRFLAGDVVVYENLTNLDKLPEAMPFTFIGLPLNFRGIDGSPVRAVAILKEDSFEFSRKPVV
ncbi:MAG: cyclase family protein [Syntrophobacteraceae bacterium]